MFYQLKDRLKRRKFNQHAKAILTTPPVVTTPGATASVLTQLQHKDVLMFLVALKSFSQQVPLNTVFILSDGTLTPNDRSILNENISSVEFIELSEVHNEKCPHGACWERLLAIAERNIDNYIIQLDSDTVTLGTLNEVTELIKDDRSFVIGTWDGQDIEPMRTNAERVMKNVNPTQDSHVQMLSEVTFLELPNCDDLNYVRGCAGFSGFAKGSIDLSFIENISMSMEGLIGNKWHEWGSEQVMSNIVVANTPEAAVLPHPKYCDCTKINATETHFIHYVGSCRFTTEHYANTVTNTITSLSGKT
ncbi:MAG: hypothetical protein KUG81_02865 [Gammaproteobacteria bacterium]|nr:hypothetical protein [Gammaproteobacteria bacterium]